MRKTHIRGSIVADQNQKLEPENTPNKQASRKRRISYCAFGHGCRVVATRLWRKAILCIDGFNGASFAGWLHGVYRYKYRCELLLL